MTELEVAAELEYQARRFGAKALSFPAIVAVGDRAPRCRMPRQRIATRRERFHARRLGRELGALHERLDANHRDR